MVAYLFNDYWEDIGTIKSFFEANLALAQQVTAGTPQDTLGRTLLGSTTAPVCVLVGSVPAAQACQMLRQ